MISNYQCTCFWYQWANVDPLTWFMKDMKKIASTALTLIEKKIRCSSWISSSGSVMAPSKQWQLWLPSVVHWPAVLHVSSDGEVNLSKQVCDRERLVKHERWGHIHFHHHMLPSVHLKKSDVGVESGLRPSFNHAPACHCRCVVTVGNTSL